jgi:non-specific serine/threonine protein kinase
MADLSVDPEREAGLTVFPTDTFVGRERELKRARAAVLRPGVRMLTVTGPAGVGKTRFAIEVVRDADEWFGSSAIVVPLAAIQQPSGIVPAIAQALEIVDQAEHLESRVVAELKTRPRLILLDNLEHLIPDAIGTIDWLIATCPAVKLLLTSRRPGGMNGEHRIELVPFVAPDDLGDAAALEQEGVQLFMDRAARRNPAFRLRPGDAAAINDLCRRVDGLPLAIELASGWSDVMKPADMLREGVMRLGQRGSDGDPRHESMLNAIAWSYQLLEPEEQALFRRLSIFVGGFSMDFVEKMVHGRETSAPYRIWEGYGIELPWWTTVEPGQHYAHACSQVPMVNIGLPPISIDPPSAIEVLVKHHLITEPESIEGVPCFDMLETIRDFGMRELKRSGELDAVRHAHAATVIAFSEMTSSIFWQDFTPLWGRRRVDAALPNVRAALTWAKSLGAQGSEIIVRIAAPLWIYWQTRGLIGEGRMWLESIRELPPSLDWLRAQESPALAFFCWIQNDVQLAETVLGEALAAMERTGLTFTKGLANLILALVEYRREPIDVIRMLQYVDLAQHWFTKWDAKAGMAACQLIYGVVARLIGNTNQALELFNSGYELMVDSGYEWGIATARYFAAETVRDITEDDPGRVPEAIAILHESLTLYWEQGDYWGAGGAISGLACVLSELGEQLQAAAYFGAASTLMNRVGASLLPTDLMTHEEKSAQLRARMGAQRYDAAFQQGAGSPEATVNRAITELRPAGKGAALNGGADVHLTERQLAVVRDLASGLDVAGVSRRRGRSLSTTYDMVHRICDRLGVDTWEEIVPFALDHGLIQPQSP